MAAWNPGGEKRERARRCIYPVFFFFSRDARRTKSEKGASRSLFGAQKKKANFGLGTMWIALVKNPKPAGIIN